jgi:hypothetical protein
MDSTMSTRPHKFPIGTQFRTGGKHPRLCTITDHMTVTNSRGEVVRTFYQATHEFCGQPVLDADVCEVTIARGLLTN